MPHVAVTGGAGFIGSNLVRALLDAGHAVTVVDDFSEGERENLAELEGREGFEVVVADIRDEDAMEAVCSRTTHMVHLAARKIPRYGGALATLDVNANGSRTVLGAALRHGQRVVIASTSDVYGTNPETPFREYETRSMIGHPKIRRWSYAVSKMYEEQVAFAMHEESGLAVTVLRYFGGYGPFQHRGWLGGPQSVFMELAHQGKPLTVHGDGTQRRTFTYVDDMVDGTVRALFTEGAVGELYNIGSTCEVSIAELAERCWRLVREDEPRIELIPYASMGGNYEDVLRRVPDPTRAREDLGFTAQVDLEDGLARTWAWMLERRLSWSSRQLWFVIPALDERDNLEQLAPKLEAACVDLGEAFHVVLVDDGSSDDTGEVASAGWGERCTVLRHPTNRGPGQAVKTGILHVFEHAGDDDLLVTIEADGTSDLGILGPMIAFCRAGWDAALASPYARGGGVKGTNAFRIVLSASANVLCRGLLGIRDVSTYSSFYRAHRVDTLRRLHEHWGERMIEERGFSYAVEMLSKLCRFGARVAEVPMVLDGSKRLGESRMRVLPTTLGYLRLFRRYGPFSEGS